MLEDYVNHALSLRWDITTFCTDDNTHLCNELRSEISHRKTGVLGVLGGQLSNLLHDLNKPRRSKTGLKDQVDRLTRGKTKRATSIVSGETQLSDVRNYGECTEAAALTDDFSSLNEERNLRARLAFVERRLGEKNKSLQEKSKPTPFPSSSHHVATHSMGCAQSRTRLGLPATTAAGIH